LASCRSDGCFFVGADALTPKRFPIGSRSCQTRSYAFADDRALELSEYPQHLEHGLSAGCGCIETLLVQIEIDLLSVEIGQQCHEVLERSPEPIHRPGGHQIEVPPSDTAQHGIKARAFIAAFRT
jgi:hypothetical protein